MCAPSDAWSLTKEGTKGRILWQNECLARLSVAKPTVLMHNWGRVWSDQPSVIGELLSLDQTSWFDQGLISLNKGARKRALERQILNMHSSCRPSIRQVRLEWTKRGLLKPRFRVSNLLFARNWDTLPVNFKAVSLNGHSKLYFNSWTLFSFCLITYLCIEAVMGREFFLDKLRSLHLSLCP